MFKFEDFVYYKVVGTGAFGKVYLASYKNNKNALFAIKTLDWKKLLKMRQVDQLENEITILKSLTTSCFVTKLISTVNNGRYVGLVMEYVTGGELFYWLKKFGCFSLYATKFYACEILCGLKHIHEKGFLYRDLKPENILLSTSGHIKLTDFGFSTRRGEVTRVISGTPEYMPPEKLLSETDGVEGDYWALGIIIYEMLMGDPPFYDNVTNIIYKKILEEPLKFPEYIDENTKDLISKLLDRNRLQRLGTNNIEEIMNHQFFCDINWDDVMQLKLQPPIVPYIYQIQDIHSFCDNDFDDLNEEKTEEKPYTYIKIFK